MRLNSEILVKMQSDKPGAFTGRQLVIATMHGKEKVIAPVLEQGLGVSIVVPEYFDTDRFGTFAGEVERPGSPLAAARLKCDAAIEQTGCSLVLASEGSFGPHPSAFFVPADDEILVLVDKASNLEYKARMLTTETNFAGALMRSREEVTEFASNALFPSHGLIVRKDARRSDGMVKGIRDMAMLEELARAFIREQGCVFVETDMRAMYNPTRMKVIERAAEKLVATLQRSCPACEAPGYAIKDIRQGLPCELCGASTKSTMAHVWGCSGCGYSQELPASEKKTESAMYCDYCNP